MIAPRSRRIASQSGIFTVEAAFILPILILITFGLISFGSVLVIQNNMLHAAKETARSLAVGETTLSEAQGTAENHLLHWGGLNFTVTPTEPNASDVSVQITGTFSEDSFLDILGLFSSEILQAQVTMRKEIG